ncbi:hypothetical protein HW130_15700 [Streptomyces sp. PKU-EA00015]|uniref:hypothetical protein n=1 Tax=Streptomyces sp. PKU-EA00015 TaxID=2748326 RepID=UPI0015A0CDD7|nr:hypothetical protein [Streptomyces sp. PKU-EA00015]NWF27690.1 hypothetical protein [Streptomyces sp. PKU-EA00015]
MVGNENLIEIVKGLVSTNPQVREETCERVCDWLQSFDQREVSVVSSLLSSVAVLESDADCLESELHAIGELTETGLVEAVQLTPLCSLSMERLDVSAREHLSYLMSEYFQ